MQNNVSLFVSSKGLRQGISGENRTGHHGVLGRVGAIGDNEAWISHVSRDIRFRQHKSPLIAKQSERSRAHDRDIRVCRKLIEGTVNHIPAAKKGQ